LQTAADIEHVGMNKAYFDRLFNWLREQDGFAHVVDWLMNYPIERGQIPIRAPKTSSYNEALQRSRSPMEVIIAECVEDDVCGFRGGYVSTIAVIKRAKAAGLRSPNTRTVQTCLEKMDYIPLGRAVRPHAQEDPTNRTELFANASHLTVQGYGRAQGYE